MKKIGLIIWDQPIANLKKTTPIRQQINTAYLDYIHGFGALPVLIHKYNAETIKECDALVLPGGLDISPHLFGEENVASYQVDVARDMFELRAINIANEFKIPILGICRGAQLLFKYHESSLSKHFVYYQHVSGHNQDELEVQRSIPTHSVRTTSGIKWVNSMHHQAIGCEFNPFTIKDSGLQVLAVHNNTKNPKFIIESFKIGDHVGVQWHPEELLDYEQLQLLNI